MDTNAELRQGSHSGGGVEERRVGVDVRRQRRVGVPHYGLGRPQGDARSCKVGAERGTEGMEINRPGEVVPLGDPREHKVALQNPQKAHRGDEGTILGIKTGSDGPSLPGGFPGRLEPLREGGADVGGEVGSEREIGPAATLLGGSGKTDERRRPVEEEVPDLERPQFAKAEPGEEQDPVGERPLAPQSGKALDPGRSKPDDRHALPWSASDDPGLGDWALLGDGEESRELILGEGATNPATVGAFVGERDADERIDTKSIHADRPVEEGADRDEVGIPRPGARPLALLLGEPLLYPGAPEVG